MERTASQTIGPFFHEGLRWRDGGVIAFAEPGKRIVLTGRIFDGAGEPVGDAMVEAWQHSPAGCAPSPARGAANPHGFGRVETAKDGTYRFETAMPGGEHPYIDIAIFARGLLKALRTRVYLEPEDKAGADPAVAALKGSPRLKTLVAAPSAGGEYRWDIRLQGDGETVFFAF
jgi:protocatechuate 3,4-dioxygenase, alpha subunit